MPKHYWADSVEAREIMMKLMRAIHHYWERQGDLSKLFLYFSSDPSTEAYDQGLQLLSIGSSPHADSLLSTSYGEKCKNVFMAEFIKRYLYYLKDTSPTTSDRLWTLDHLFNCIKQNPRFSLPVRTFLVQGVFFCLYMMGLILIKGPSNIRLIHFLAVVLFSAIIANLYMHLQISNDQNKDIKISRMINFFEENKNPLSYTEQLDCFDHAFSSSFSTKNNIVNKKRFEYLRQFFVALKELSKNILVNSAIINVTPLAWMAQCDLKWLCEQIDCYLAEAILVEEYEQKALEKFKALHKYQYMSEFLDHTKSFVAQQKQGITKLFESDSSQNFFKNKLSTVEVESNLGLMVCEFLYG